MGRKKHRFNSFAQKKRERKEQSENEAKGEGYQRTQPTYESIVRECPDFEKYYKAQKIVSEEEWPVFFETIKKDLPTSFRITGSRDECQVMLNVVKSEFFKDFLNDDKQPKVSNGEEKTEETNESDGIAELKPYCLPWYPDGLAWQLQLTRKDIRRSETYFKLHNFLISETQSGNISRQEAVSMIPPIALDVKSHHKVLDMCAAPGSKTAQLIESLHSTLPPDQQLPSGFVIANDCDNNRCYMLVHQAKRLNSPCILIVNHDATVFPNLHVNDNITNTPVPLKYDRILCDVPCSGDGTLRKNPDIWTKWNCANGNNLHGIQSKIIRRGAELLAVGGRLVYSTCSLNPIENEAVICRLLAECGDSLKLVDPRHLLPDLKHKNGMTDWKPASKDLIFYDKVEDVPEKWFTCVRPQMFPPSKEELEKFEIEKCLRILPQQQDTGGFFIAVIEKVSLLPWETIAKVPTVPTEQPKSNDEQTPSVEPPPKKRRLYGFKEDPFVFFKDDEDVWDSIQKFYDIKPEFDPKCLMTRCLTGKKKNIYFCSKNVRDIVLRNESKLKIINTGVKTFVRCDNRNMECAFRLGNEGLLSILPFIGTRRIINIKKTDLMQILLHNNPQDPPDVTILEEPTQNQVAKLSSGSCALKYVDKDLQLHLSGWRGTRSLRAYVTKCDTVHILRLLGEDTSKYETNKFKKDASPENNDPAEITAVEELSNIEANQVE